MKSNNYAFLVTSAVNTKFGVYNSEQRLQQTLDTIKSIKQAVPDAAVILIEMSALPLTHDQRQAIEAMVDQVIDYTNDPGVHELYHSTDNWDVVKNVNEVICFARALAELEVSQILSNVQRLFKISGRYTLTAHFDIGFYNQPENQNKIVVSRAKGSQFHPSITGGIQRQYMSRLWSWPKDINKEIIQVYDNSLIYMFERLQNNGYADIEHTLYRFLDQKKVHELDRIGVAGNIGPNGVAVED
jgi:hypothetical protein